MSRKPEIRAVKKKQEPIKLSKPKKNTRRRAKSKKKQVTFTSVLTLLLISIVICGLLVGRTKIQFYYLDDTLIEDGEAEALLLDTRSYFPFQNIEAPTLDEISDDDISNWRLGWIKDIEIEKVSFSDIAKTYKWYAYLIDESADEITIDLPIQTGSEYISDYGNYYDEVIKNGITKSNLTARLKEEFKPTSYNDAGRGGMLVEADTPSGKDYVYGVYNGQEFEQDWLNGKNFEREHVWPNARLGMKRVTSTGKNQASDLHNLRAISGVYTGTLNQKRSDRFFEDCTNNNDHAPHTIEKDPDAFCLGKGEVEGKVGEHRGDVARIFMYMLIMYDDILKIPNTRNDLITYEAYAKEDSYLPLWGTSGAIDTLLKWHKLDPVDDFEKHRNDVIFQYQKNRNPFIDYQEWADIIWTI